MDGHFMKISFENSEEGSESLFNILCKQFSVWRKGTFHCRMASAE